MPVNTPRSHHIDRRARTVAALGGGLPDDLLTERTLAEWLGLSMQWLQVGRSAGCFGPPFIRIGRRIRYRRGDVLAWLDERRHHRTSEYKRNGRPPEEGDKRPAGREPGDKRTVLVGREEVR